MDTDDRTQLQAQRFRLESGLLAIEKALVALAPAADQAERAQLTAEMQAQLAQLSDVNTRLSVLGRPGSAT